MKSQAKFVSCFFFSIQFVQVSSPSFLHSRVVSSFCCTQSNEEIAWHQMCLCALTQWWRRCVRPNVCVLVYVRVCERDTVHAFLGLSKSKPRLKIGASIQPLTELYPCMFTFLTRIGYHPFLLLLLLLCMWESLLSIYCRLDVPLASTGQMRALKPATYQRNQIIEHYHLRI